MRISWRFSGFLSRIICSAISEMESSISLLYFNFPGSLSDRGGRVGSGWGFVCFVGSCVWKGDKVEGMSEEENSNDENSLEHLEFDSATPLEQDAAQMHEMFQALCKVGFTERQSLQLVAFLMTEASEDGAVNLFFDETFLKRMHDGFPDEEEDDGQNS